MKKKLIEKINYSNNLYILVSVCLGILFTQIKIFNDDGINIGFHIGNLSDFIYNQGIKLYFTWNSRFLINLILLTVMALGKYAFGLLMGVTAYILLYSLSQWTGAEELIQKLIIITIVLSFPYQILCTLGWITTSVSYFIPTVLALFGSLTIRNIYYKLKVKPYLNILYILSVLVGANLEQAAALLLFVYTVMLIFFIKNKYDVKSLVPFLIQYGIILISIAYTLICPGNAIRFQQETAKYFKSFSGLNVINKLDIGFFTSINFLVAGQLTLVLLTTLLLILLIWNKTQCNFKRIMSLFPLVTVIYYIQPIAQFFQTLFHDIGYIPTTVAKLGMIKQGIAERGWLLTGVQIFTYIFFIINICLLIHWLLDNCYEKLLSISFVIGGMVSGTVMGFYPSIYALGSSIHIVMIMSLMPAVLIAFVSNFKFLSEKSKALICYGSMIIIPLAALSLGIIINVVDK